jgi:hypothetical protein
VYGASLDGENNTFYFSLESEAGLTQLK